ncbi:MAG: amidohydrolase family protein [Acidimicrobiia bacterium]
MSDMKIWTHSGDSHFLEPDDLWHQILPQALADRMPRTRMISDDEEIVEVDGTSFTRKVPRVMTAKNRETGETIGEMSHRPPGSRDIKLRLHDLDQEGVWGEVMYQSIGMWCSLIEDPALMAAAARAENDWIVTEIQSVAPDRLVPAALMPMLDVDAAIAEVRHAAEIGLHIISLPSGQVPGRQYWNHKEWDPLWAATEEAGLVIGFHIGTNGDPVKYGGRGGAVINYVESGRDGIYASMSLVAAGVFERHPDLKVLVSEGGATWVPYIGDRMNEAYRQHSMWVNPPLAKLPKEYLYSNVYASFQHDETAPAAMSSMGYRNVMFGSDYPHLEGTYGHTQKTLHELFDDVTPEVRHRITRGAFEELFPHVSTPPA